MLVNVVTMLVNVDTMLVNVVTMFLWENYKTVIERYLLKYTLLKCIHSWHIKLLFNNFYLSCFQHVKEKVIFVNVDTTHWVTTLTVTALTKFDKSSKLETLCGCLSTMKTLMCVYAKVQLGIDQYLNIWWVKKFLMSNNIWHTYRSHTQQPYYNI